MASLQGSTGQLYRLKTKQLRVDGTELYKISNGTEIVDRYGLLTASSSTRIREKQIKLVDVRCRTNNGSLLFISSVIQLWNFRILQFCEC